jgi:regulator of nucleoside diphosphate kinase
MIMHLYKSIALPSFEYARLQHLMLTMIGSRTALASVLRRKLGAGEPVSASAVAADIALSGREVHFGIDGRHSETRILTWDPQKRGDASNLSLLSPRGLALLGLRPGESVSYHTEGGRTEFLKVERVTDGETHAPAHTVSRTAHTVSRITTPQLPDIPESTRIAGPAEGGPNA